MGLKPSCPLLGAVDEEVGSVGKEALDHGAAAVVVLQKLCLEQEDLLVQAGNTTDQVVVSLLQVFFVRFEPQGVLLLLESELVGRDSVSILESFFAFEGLCRFCESRSRLTRTLAVVRRIAVVAGVLVFGVLLTLGCLAFAFRAALVGHVAFAVILGVAAAPAATVAGVNCRNLRFSWRLYLWFDDSGRRPVRVWGRWTVAQAECA